VYGAECTTGLSVWSSLTFASLDDADAMMWRRHSLGGGSSVVKPHVVIDEIPQMIAGLSCRCVVKHNPNPDQAGISAIQAAAKGCLQHTKPGAAVAESRVQQHQQAAEKHTSE
jgi:hypothetical protein